MDDQGLHWTVVVISLAVPVIGGLVAIWWKVESRQDRKLESLQLTNGKEHKDLHDKIDKNHHAIRDKLDHIWQNISKRNP